jgi:hypothetical protein
MINWPTTSRLAPTFTTTEWEALRELRRRYQQDRDLFTTQELARLRFIAWLRRTRET